MKRFYCTICKKVKRVQSSQFPKVGINLNNLDPNTRLGKCNRHLFNKKAGQ